MAHPPRAGPAGILHLRHQFRPDPVSGRVDRFAICYQQTRRCRGCHGMADYTFRRVLRVAGITSGRERACRVHDLRHTFATRALEQCSTQGRAVARHFVALATYMGHTDIAHTYWYLEATPELMAGIAAAGEALMVREGAR